MGLTDPMLIGIQLAIFGIAMAFYMKTLSPQTEPEILQTRFAGKAGFVLSILIPVVLGLVEFAKHGYRKEAFGTFLSIVVLSILHGTFIYYSFFHWVYSPQAFEGIATAQRFLQFRSERRIWRAVYVGCSFLFCGAGILMFVGFVGLAFGAAIGEFF